MLKKFISIMMCFAFVLCMMSEVKVNASTIVASGNDLGEDKIAWVLDSEGIMTFSGDGNIIGSEYLFMFPLPWNEYKESIKKVVIEDGIRSIGMNAFNGCTNLTEVIISETVGEIYPYAFYGCSKLDNIQLPDSIYHIDSSAFVETGYYNNRDNWENNVLYIDKYLISGHYANYEYDEEGSIITGIEEKAKGKCEIKEGTITIAHDAFQGCDEVTEIIIPDSVRYIGGFAFSDTAYYSNENNWENGLLYIGNHFISGNTKPNHIDAEVKSGICEIKPGTMSLAYDAFNSCDDITAIVIPESLKSGLIAIQYFNQPTNIYYEGDEDEWKEIRFEAPWYYTQHFEPKYTIKYNVVKVDAEAEHGAVEGEGFYTRGDTVTVKVSANSGYKFKGWYVGETLVSEDSEYTFVVDDNVELVAEFKKSSSGRYSGGGSSSTITSYKVNFATDGGSSIASQTVTKGDIAKKPENPIKNGFIFGGWYADKELTVVFDFETKITKNTTLYAKWTGINDVVILTIGEKTATVFGKEMENDVAPKLVNSRTMLPARFVAESLGAEVIWTAEELNKVVIKKDDVEIIIYIGSDKAYVNGEEVILDSPAFLENDRTYIPIRFVSEEIGAEVDWIQETNQVVITKK